MLHYLNEILLDREEDKMAVEIRLLPGEGMVSQDRDIVSGAPVFVGTRTPISTLFDYLVEGHSLMEYYDDFPGVTPAHTRAVLDLAREIVTRESFPSRDALPHRTR